MSSAVLNGITYRQGTVVICGMEDEVPMFGRITEIIVTPLQECMFVVTALMTIAFQHHYHAYEALPANTTVVHHRQLFDYYPLVSTKVVGRGQSLFISTKYHLFS